MNEIPIPTLVAARSPGSSQIKQETAGGPAALAVINVEKIKEWLPAVSLAIAVGALIFAWASHTEGRLAQYEVTDHIQNAFDPAVVRLGVLEHDVADLKTTKAVTEACHK